MINTAAIKKERDEKLKALDEEFKAREAELSLEVAAARDHADVIATIEQQKLALARDHLAQRAAIEAKAEKESQGVVKGEGGATAATQMIAVQKQALEQEQKANNERVASAMMVAQTQIKLLDQQMQTDLKVTEQAD